MTSYILQNKASMVSKASNSRKVQIVYYLSRGGQLEHPHLLELSISSTEGLYLKDVKKRLTTIRGKGMPSSFSWSYKRSYKNGYVWQDLADDDLIFPAHGCEYVLKGSRIADPSPNRSAYTATQDTKNEPEFRASCPIEVHTSSMLVRNNEIKNTENSGRETFPDSYNSHTTFEQDQLGDGMITIRTDQEVEISSQKLHDSSNIHLEREQPSKQEVPKARKLHEYKVYTKPTSTVLVEIGTDAATQTEDQEKSRHTKSPTKESQALVAKISNSGDAQKPTELDKGEISPPPSSSSGTSRSTSSNTGGGSPVGREKHGKDQGLLERERLDAPTSSTQTLARKSARANGPSLFQSEEWLLRSKSKSSSSSAFLQIFSCGGLDIKEEIHPMSMYMKAKDPFQPVEKFCDLLRLGHSRQWRRSCKRVTPKPKHRCAEASGGSASVENLALPAPGLVEGSLGSGRREGDVSGLSCTPDDHAEAVLPDVISIERSAANSDRSSDVSRELSYPVIHSKRRGCNGRKHFPVFGSDESVKPESHLDRPDSAGCITLATPSKSDQKNYREQLQLLAMSSGQFEAAAGETNRIRARKAMISGSDSGIYQNKALVWEEIVAPRKIFNNRDERPLPPERSKADWERTLQYAVDMSLPPPDFHQLLQECLQCGRKFRPESLKVHLRGCNSNGNQKSRCKSKDTKNDPRFSNKPTQMNPIVQTIK